MKFLSTLCIEYIASHFDDFLEILKTKQITEDVKVLLFSFFQQRGTLSKDIVEAFLPKSQTILNLEENIHLDADSLKQIGVISGNTLTSISLADCYFINDEALQILSLNAANIVRLDLTGCYPITSKGIEKLVKNCKKMNELDLSECIYMDDLAVAYLLTSSTLTILTLAECPKVLWQFQKSNFLDEIGNIIFQFDFLTDIKANIRSLCLRHSNITDDSISVVTQTCHDLRILDLSWCFRLTPNCLDIITTKKYDKLFAFNIWGLKSTSDLHIQKVCRSFPSLSSLTLCDNIEITEHSMISIIAMSTNIHSLSLWGCTKISGPSVRLLIRHMTKLQGLGLQFCPHVDDDSILGLRNLSLLKSLQFEGCNRLTDKSLDGLGSTNITSINFRRCSLLTNSALEEVILRSPNITNLNLSHIQLSKDSLSHVVMTSSQLKMLDVSGNKNIDDSFLTTIMKGDMSAKLISLKLDECLNISDTGVSLAIKSCTQLKNFSASFCSQLTDESFYTLSKNSFRMSSVSLGGCGKFTDITIQRFSAFCPKLKDLILPWNKQITDKSLEFLSRGCKNLRTLNVAYCNLLTDEGMTAIASKCRALKRLDLGFCSGITTTGVLSMLSIAPKTLQHLRVKKNPSDEVFAFVEQQASRMFFNLTIETTT